MILLASSPRLSSIPSLTHECLHARPEGHEIVERPHRQESGFHVRAGVPVTLPKESLVAASLRFDNEPNERGGKVRVTHQARKTT